MNEQRFFLINTNEKLMLEVEEQIWSNVQSTNNETFQQKYVDTWQDISAPVLAPSFDREGRRSK